MKGNVFSRPRRPTKRFYKKSLTIIWLLNNLAWLLATNKEQGLFQPQKALSLARKAVTLKPDPMILDTLAEAYLANGRPDLALQVARQVLAKNPSNRAYYQAQEERFKQAVKRGKL